MSFFGVPVVTECLGAQVVVPWVTQRGQSISRFKDELGPARLTEEAHGTAER